LQLHKIKLMPLKLYAAALFALTTVFSCAQKDDSPAIDESLLNAVKSNPARVNVPTDSILTKPNTTQQQVTGFPAATTTTINPQANKINIAPPANVVQPPTVTASAKLNPAHGQPGHRCDINVGAPLDSKPATAPIPAQAKQVVNAPTAAVTVPPTAPTQKTAPGMNPTHGQPGHRCDISVGAPLNSKPAAPPAPVIAPPPQADSSKNK
jgi:hypothetical protein